MNPSNSLHARCIDDGALPLRRCSALSDAKALRPVTGSGPVTRLAALLLVAAVFTCNAQVKAGEDPVAREQELAKNDVWHAAKLRGVAFRALGQEPGWLLEITNGEEILLVTDYGQNRNAYPYVEPQEDKTARRTLFQLDTETSVLLEGKPCSDSMSGEQFETTVTVKTATRTLSGCGRALF